MVYRRVVESSYNLADVVSGENNSYKKKAVKVYIL